MEVIKTFGRIVDKVAIEHPERARKLLRFGWSAQDLKLRVKPDKRLLPADQYLTRIMMDLMLRPLRHPEESILISIFTPCELMQEAGLYPYNVESFSSFLAGTQMEQLFLQIAEEDGLAETLCSYHKIFIGAAHSGIMPKPKCIAYTSLACDANLVTFKHLADYFDVPCYAIDVPSGHTEEDVRYVADQLRELKGFLETNTGRKIDDEKLKMRLQRRRKTLQTFDEAQTIRAEKYVPADLAARLYCLMANNIMLGMEEEAKFVDMLKRDIQNCEPAHGIRLYWHHIIPFWSDAVRSALSLQERAQIVGVDFSQVVDLDHFSEDPYEAMAQRLIYHVMNGSVVRRIEHGIRRAKELHADGAVWFDHWGCKHTLGGAQLAKKMYEEAGIPLLLLDGDGCDRSHGGEGQTATRLGAFLEMLEAGKT